jgi:hypothetical protein
MKTTLSLLFTFVMAFHFAANADVKDSATGLSFPSEVSFTHEGKGYKLEATGVSTRKKLFIKIYSIVSYLQDAAQATKSDIFDEILKDGKAKQLTLKFVRSVPADKVMEGYHDSFKTALAGRSSPELNSLIEKYIDLFNHEAKEGEEQVIRWLPGGYVEVLFNGKVGGSFTNVEFAKTLWSIWFGPKGVVNRDQLVTYIH